MKCRRGFFCALPGLRPVPCAPKMSPDLLFTPPLPTCKRVRETVMTINRELEAKARGLAGLKGYTTSLTTVGAEFVIDAYHQLWRVEKSFRMSKHDLPGPTGLPPQTRIHRRAPDHRVRRSGRQPLDRDPNRMEHQEIRAHRTPLPHRPNPRRPTILTAADPLPEDLREVIAQIGRPRRH